MVSLQLRSFRCHTATSLQWDSPMVCITGPNGSGKTSILEALSFLSPGRGLRYAKAEDLQNCSSTTPWSVTVVFETSTGPLKIDLFWDKQKRHLNLNGVAAKGQKSLTEWIRLLWVTPAMARLWEEGASGRRRYFDRLVFTIFPEYGSCLLRYEKAMKERLHILCEGGSSVWLQNLEKIMAEDMLRIGEYRQKTLNLLEEAFKDSPLLPSVSLRLSGLFESLISTDIQKQLMAYRREDQLSKRGQMGPHRSLFEVYNQHHREAAYCSTGEQKMLLYTLTAAMAQILTKQCPLHLRYLLIDESISHLDEGHRTRLIQHLSSLDWNIVMSSCEATAYAGHKIHHIDLKCPEA